MVVVITDCECEWLAVSVNKIPAQLLLDLSVLQLNPVWQ